MARRITAGRRLPCEPPLGLSANPAGPSGLELLFPDVQGGFHTYVDPNVAEERTLIVLGNVDSLDVDALVRLPGGLPPKEQGVTSSA